jgi:hypothetical protein
MDKKVVVSRVFGDDKQTLGVLSVVGDNGVIFTAKTLELPDKNNQPRISCIPEGEYECVFTKSNSFSKSQGKDVFTYEIKKVPGRAGIRIHSANFFYQLLGCIALGSSHKDINSDGNLDILHSGKTITEFEEVMERKPFVLKVTKSY